MDDGGQWATADSFADVTNLSLSAVKMNFIYGASEN